ncbi:2-dehydropantoate 2-reductase [Fredinandcohnia quinoae]|uniref:2-dehydropantoate 2-reductase n=1 Tax=Fredinandcohnia quinoae TaxID=2918902 RepID=A0AAW5E1X7_9BACI|nr:2-dehydropantoate 2-reductase [Fredinandcohnia sp. SECRCQ15]MCH1623887.1 2-dehydropantoate 2-reductase [Fredinandcohnia sp. SECRCQ15]
MRVGILGGGSIGLLFAAYLANTNDVTVYTRTERQASLLNKNGVTLLENDSSNTYKINATFRSQLINNEEILIIALKQYDLQHVMSIFVDVDKVSTIIFLQNGMDHIEYIEQLKNKNLLLGVVEHGALKVDETTVIHTGVGITKYGVYRGNINAITLLDKHGTFSKNFPLLIEENWLEMLSAKLVVNAVINPLTALFKVENGQLLLNQYFYRIMHTLFQEIITVIHISNEKKMWMQVEGICKKTSSNRSSMLKDIEEERKTEIDAILGYILRQAENKNKSLPLTSFLFEAIKGIEERGSK